MERRSRLLDQVSEGFSSMQVFCPHCQNTFESAHDAQGEILCPACGSSFCLDQERTRTQVVEHRKLGKFELLDQVGSGAFGTVWYARDTELDRLVAIKIPHSGQLAGEKEAQRFVREARSAAQLRHPGIVTVHEVGRLREPPLPGRRLHPGHDPGRLPRGTLASRPPRRLRNWSPRSPMRWTMPTPWVSSTATSSPPTSSSNGCPRWSLAATQISRSPAGPCSWTSAWRCATTPTPP